MHLKLTNITSGKIVCGLQIKGGVCHFYQRSKKNLLFPCLCFPNASWSRKKPYVHCPFDQLMINPFFSPQSETVFTFFRMGEGVPSLQRAHKPSRIWHGPFSPHTLLL